MLCLVTVRTARKIPLSLGHKRHLTQAIVRELLTPAMQTRSLDHNWIDLLSQDFIPEDAAVPVYQMRASRPMRNEQNDPIEWLTLTMVLTIVKQRPDEKRTRVPMKL